MENYRNGFFNCRSVLQDTPNVGRRDDHYIDAYMTLLHIWWLINRIKTYRFGLSIDIGHDGVIDHM